MEILAQNSYPGRGMVLGVDESGNYAVQVYWLTGRSESSRNRILKKDGRRIFTAVADPDRSGDTDKPALKYYTAMTENAQSFHYVVGNGIQTSDVIRYINDYGRLSKCVASFSYEPDPPIFTPRITGLTHVYYSRDKSVSFELSIIRKSRRSDEAEHFSYEYESIGRGVGYGIMTYAGDGNPPPVFEGEPQLLPLRGSVKTILTEYWNVLNKENRVALAVKFIDLGTGESNTEIQNSREEKNVDNGTQG